jgi:N-acetyl-anhydromuramyl-L-alanine amidase AmpD
MKQFSIRRPFRRRILSAVMAFAALLISAAPMTALAATQNNTEAKAFTSAAGEFGVPEQVLLAVSYHQSRWESYAGQMSVDGGFGPMNLRTKVAVEDGRGDPNRPVPAGTTTTGEFTLDMAAKLLKQSPDTLKNDTAQNIRGGAAVLAGYAKQLNGGKLPTDTQGWYSAVARMSGATDTQNAASFADDVYATLKAGVSATTTSGQHLSVTAQANLTTPNASQLSPLGLRNNTLMAPNNATGAECPTGLDCRFVPAAYAPNSSDPTDYGNYDHSNRPQDMKIKYIVIHDTEGSYQSAISHFQDTTAFVSAHYVIRSSDGAITQMVSTKDTAWHAGDWWVNMHSIGIEHEGEAQTGASWYTEAMYHSSARLVRYLANKYGIPLDRDHIIGHDNVPGLSDAKAKTMHWDPGPFWDWDHYMDLVQNKAPGTNARQHSRHGTGPGRIVTINPEFSKNPQTMIPCDSHNNCSGLVTAPSNFVYLHTAPREDSPLITDPLLHPDGQPGTIRMNDWTAKAATGQQYALVGRQGDWTAIWHGNQRAWFHNPDTQPTAAVGHGHTIQLKTGLDSTHVYGGAYPETSVYPADVHGPVQSQLSYMVRAGQQYVSDGVVPTDYFYDWTIDYSAPHDHEIFTGNDTFIKIWYNQRTMFVRASDVVVQ